jgi:hypothetical protein
MRRDLAGTYGSRPPYMVVEIGLRMHRSPLSPHFLCDKDRNRGKKEYE